MDPFSFSCYSIFKYSNCGDSNVAATVLDIRSTDYRLFSFHARWMKLKQNISLIETIALEHFDEWSVI